MTIETNIGKWRWSCYEHEYAGERYIYCQGDRGGMMMSIGQWQLMLDAEWERITPDHKQTTPSADME